MLGDIQAVYVVTFAVSIGGVKAALNRAERCYLNRFEQDFRVHNLRVEGRR
jgi:hypothetical protein